MRLKCLFAARMAAEAPMILMLLTVTAPAQECESEAATTVFREAFEYQKKLRTEEALGAYSRCLEIEPTCVPCQYEIGWSYWTRSEYTQAADAWEKTLKLDPNHQAAATWLPSAKDNGKLSKMALSKTGVRIPIGTKSEPAEAPVKLELVARFQNYNANPSHEADHHDMAVHSPKSARYLPDASRVYINSLEGYLTVVYDPVDLSQIRLISHIFEAEHAPLFHGQSTIFDYPYNRKSSTGDPNQFAGKPVESEISHDRWLWIPYYRRDFDRGATSPSAVSIIDTRTDEIVRVMPTGPIPKYIAASPDGKWVVVTHWGDNTLGVIDTSSGDPATFAYRTERLVVDEVLGQKGLAGTNRDSSCGYCLRGTTFTPDSEVLLVARMGGDGGLAGFDVATWTYLGTLTGEKPTPRHLLVVGEYLYMTNNRSGYLTKAPLTGVVKALRGAKGTDMAWDGWAEVAVGGGARTVDASPDGKYLFVAVNGRAEVVVVDAEKMKVVTKVRADSYPVGLAVSPKGDQLWTTSQGRSSKGGNSVCVFSIEREQEDTEDATSEEAR